MTPDILVVVMPSGAFECTVTRYLSFPEGNEAEDPVGVIATLVVMSRMDQVNVAGVGPGGDVGALHGAWLKSEDIPIDKAPSMNPVFIGRTFSSYAGLVD